MVVLRNLNLDLEGLENDSLLVSALELSKELGETMQSSIFIALQDAINSKSGIEIIDGKITQKRMLVTTDFVFSDER